MGERRYRAADAVAQGYIALVGILVLLFHGDSVPHWPVVVGVHLMAVLVIHALIRSAPGGILGFVRDFYPILLLSLLWRELGWINQMFVSSYQDAIFVAWDQVLFGTQPSVKLMDRFPGRWTGEVFYGAYFSYYLMIVGVGAALYWRCRGQFRHYLSVLVTVLFACYLVYLVLPVIGARVFAHEFTGYRLPEGLCDITWPHPYPESVTQGWMYGLMGILYRHFEVDGAAFPSSHVAVSLCTLTFSWRYLRRVRYLHLVMFVLLCISTVYCRYHYAVDVFAGLLYGGAWCWLGERLYRRLEPAPHRETDGREPECP